MSGITDLRKFYLIMAFGWIGAGTVSSLALGWDSGYWGMAKLMSGFSFVMAGFNHLARWYFARTLGEDIKI